MSSRLLSAFIVASFGCLWVRKAAHGRSAEPILKTPNFAASQDDKVLNVHVVPHTHDDVGWLKTVEEYYYGFNSTIQRAHVQAILDSTISSLLKNKNRTFTYVEQKFFSMWWNEQTLETKGTVRQMVAEDRFAFVNGGWCMHDEATTHFMGMIDQTSLGHAFLKKELGVVPTVGWQLDPFGHSSSQASYMTSLMGFDALYFGRIDHQDLKLRQESQSCEGLWDASPHVGDPIFWGLTGSFGGNYGPPAGFCFDTGCDDEPLVGLSEEILLERIKTLVQDFKVQSDRTKGDHIMLTMGEDFNYENAEVFMKNNDLMIHSVIRFQESKQIDVSSIFESEYDRINIFYSNPNYYTQQKYLEMQRRFSANDTSEIWNTKTDDFFPYADFDNGYWTGYFVSRTGFKRLERVASSVLMAARQVESYRSPNAGVDGCKCMEPLFDLEDALGVAQHHDAISGTAKQHVANDYAKRVTAGVHKASSYMAKKIKELLLDKNAADTYLHDFGYCQLLNETICEISEDASRIGSDLYVVVYNALASVKSTIVGIPVTSPGIYSIQRVDNVNSKVKVSSSSVEKNGKYVVYFDTGLIPPTGAVAFCCQCHRMMLKEKLCRPCVNSSERIPVFRIID
ncbi:Alpha mannosidase [Fragilaria crotonensis]|nr:Alpha mannosidase [Fragilaria crotonensis]